MPISDELINFLTELHGKAGSEVAETLSTVVQREVNISPGEIEDFAFNNIKEKFSESVVLVSFGVTENPDDMVYIVVEKDITAKLSAWMMMEEADEVEFTDEHLDSIRETTSQVLGTLTTSLTEEMGRKIEFHSTRAEVVDLSPELFPEEETFMMEYNVSFGEDAQAIVYEVSTVRAAENFRSGEEPVSETAEVAKEAEDDEISAEEGEKSEVDLAASFGEEPAVEEGGAGLPGDEAIPEVEEEGPEEIPHVPGVDESRIAILMDLSFPISIELGRTRMLIKDVLELGHGSVIEFDKLAGEPVDLLINDRKIAEGEVVVIEEHFGIRLTNLIRPADRLKQLGGN